MMPPKFVVPLAIIFAIPLLRVSLFFIPPLDSRILRSINAVFGRLEWAIRPLRDSVLLLAMMAFSAYEIYNNRLISAVWLAPFILLSIFSILRYHCFAKKISVLAKDNPYIHPKEFFKGYYSGFGFIPTKLPAKAPHPIDPFNCSFKTGKASKNRVLPVIIGVFNTWTMAHLVIRSYKWKGPEFARDVAKSMITIWGARALYLGRLSLKTSGLDKLKDIDGKIIFALDHKSFLDFAIAPLLLNRFDPRFLAARDHFIDNPLLYLLMGRAMKLIGTIFVDRKNAVKSAQKAAFEAVEALSELPISIVIFPQGTRAHSCVSANGKRLDSGYYTSGNKDRLLKPCGYIKKGAAYITIDTALHLKDNEQFTVHLVPIAIINTGLAIPLGKMSVRTETDITVKIGEPITITKKDIPTMIENSDSYTEQVNKVLGDLDLRLRALLEVHARLEQRFFKDIRGLIPATDYEHVSVAMKAWRGSDNLIYTILDCIYASDPTKWPIFLRELCYLMVSDAPVATLNHFKGRILDNL